jgi:MFS family permease
MQQPLHGDAGADTASETRAQAQASWMPMVVIGMTQILMVFNISTLQVSIEGIVSSFNTPATTVGTAIVAYSLVVAGFIMLGARLAARLGSRRVFRAMVLLFGAAMGIMAISPDATTMIVAQLVAGAAAAALVPTLVVLIADNYRGEQKAKALGWLGGTQAMGIVLAFLIAGSLATWIGWRFTFGLLVLLAVLIYRLSAKLPPIPRQPGVMIDYVGVALAATAIILISVGANNLTHWGLLLAGPGAPFSVLDMSPAPFMIVLGLFLLEAFLEWSLRRRHSGGTTLVALDVIDTPKERSALFSMFAIGAIGSALTFLIPLYVQIVQGGTSFAAALALLPFSVASFLAAVLVVRIQGRVSPREIARYAFLLMAGSLALLGAVVRNDWSNAIVTVGMFVAGVGEGALITLLFNVLVMASPRELAGDVGSLRGTTNNLAAGVGTALASTLVVGVLSTSIHRELVHNGRIPTELQSQVDLDNVSFTSNAQLRRTLERTTATPEQVREAESINTDSRLLALKVTFFALAGLALLAYFPAGRLPGSAPRGVPAATPA